MPARALFHMSDASLMLSENRFQARRPPNVLMFSPLLSCHRFSLVRLVLIFRSFILAFAPRVSHASLSMFVQVVNTWQWTKSGWQLVSVCLISVDCWPTAEGQNGAASHTHPHSHEKSGYFRWRFMEDPADIWRELQDAESGPIRCKLRKFEFV